MNKSETKTSLITTKLRKVAECLDDMAGAL